MPRGLRGKQVEFSRRELLAAAGSALTGAAAFGLAGQGEAAKRHPGRGGTLRFALRTDTTGLDPHRNIHYLVSTPMAATTQGLVDLNVKSEPVPGVATGWEASKDLLTYTFKLRKGALFHNGREIDAEAVKWNFDRMRDPKKTNALIRSAVENLQDIAVVDKYTIRFHLHLASAAFPADVVYYPCGLMAPDSEEQADNHPIGCGPFKFVRWERNNLTELARFEDYFETDAEGNNLPYLDGIIGYTKKEDRIRLTALRSNEVHLIDNMAYADASDFAKKYAGQYQTWEVPVLGTALITFNMESGPFKDKTLRQAAAHAIDHDAIHQAVFYGRGDIARSFYAKASPWYVDGVTPWPEYDPEKAKFLIKKAKAEGTAVILQAENSFPYMQQTGELVQAMWTEVGFKVNFGVYDGAVMLQKRRSGEFHADSMAASYRFDPDGWFSRQILSTAPNTRENSRFVNEKVDKLIVEARSTADKPKRIELYAAIDSIINAELPVLYSHHLTLLEAGATNLQGYQPAISGAFSVQGAGIRTAWLA